MHAFWTFENIRSGHRGFDNKMLVGALEHFFFFIHVLGKIIPTVTHSIIFQRGRAKNHQPECVHGFDLFSGLFFHVFPSSIWDFAWDQAEAVSAAPPETQRVGGEGSTPQLLKNR
jgi:hypothetical protein